MAGQVLSDINAAFWSERFWLPANATWAHMESRKDIFIPNARELWITIPVAIGLFLARLLWERFIALPIGRHFGIREKTPQKAEPVALLEESYIQHRKMPPTHDKVLGLAKQLDWTPRQVERWWRKRRVQGKPSEMQRFRETSWRFLFYFIAFWSGVVILYDKSWTWDTRNCWYDYPDQHVTSDIYWYYMLELGFYFSLVMSLFMDIKRKDFLEMIIHHFATITLMLMSYSANMVRIGSLVLLVHDAVDYWMEGAKLAKYMKYHKLCDILFVIFTLVWFVTRIVIFPLKIIRSATFELHEILGLTTVMFFLNGLLIVLQVLHIIWFGMILRMVQAYIINGQVDRDERSDTEIEPSSEEETDDAADNDVKVNGDNGHLRSRKQGHGHETVSNNNVSNGVEAKKAY